MNNRLLHENIRTFVYILKPPRLPHTRKDDESFPIPQALRRWAARLTRTVQDTGYSCQTGEIQRTRIIIIAEPHLQSQGGADPCKSCKLRACRRLIDSDHAGFSPVKAWLKHGTLVKPNFIHY
jgi:hypothetical protein